jgi:hypothetical protein
VWTIYVAIITSKDRASPALTSWLIVNLQTFLMFNYYRHGRCWVGVCIIRGWGGWGAGGSRGACLGSASLGRPPPALHVPLVQQGALPGA